MKPRGLLTLSKSTDGASSSQELADLNSLLEDPIVMPASDVRRTCGTSTVAGDAWWEADVHDIDVHGLHQGYLKVLERTVVV